MPAWTDRTAALTEAAREEMKHREQEALTSVSRILSMQREGHDSGHNAIINHCPFCGSGAVIGNSDGSVSCDFCSSKFTVQVQPNHPHMPQTIDGQPVTPPGMPGGDETEMSSTSDPAVSAGEGDDPLDSGDPTDPAGAASNGPVAPGQPPSKQPDAPAKADPATNPGKGEDGDSKSQPPWLKKKKSGLEAMTFRTASGAALGGEAYMAHLALGAAEDRDAVLDVVRMRHTAVNKVDCPTCHGSGEIDTGRREHDTDAPVTVECTRCHGTGQVDADHPENFELREPPQHEGSMRPFDMAPVTEFLERGRQGATSKTTRTVDIEFQGETRTVEITSYNDFSGANCGTEDVFVGTIGRGSAKYPTSATLWKVTDARPARGRDTVVTDSEGQQWVFSTNTVIRNQQARITGWIEGATNERHQVRRAARDLVRHQVKAHEVRIGDYLDITGKTRVHNTLTRNGHTTLAWRQRGSKAPGVRKHPEHEPVYVWRKP